MCLFPFFFFPFLIFTKSIVKVIAVSSQVFLFPLFYLSPLLQRNETYNFYL